MELSHIYVCCVSAGGCHIGNEFHMSLYEVDTCIMELINECMYEVMPYEKSQKQSSQEHPGTGVWGMF